jgi:hypothetical protein
MATTDKALKISIQGDATQLGAATRQAVGQLNDVKQAAMGLMAGFTGGLIGGGIAGAVTAVVGMVAQQIREARALVREAEALDISPGRTRAMQRAGNALADDPSSITSAMTNARQARADALAGSPEAVRNFERLGIALEEIRNLKPDELFLRIAKAFSGGITQDRRVGAAGVLGRSEADALVPFLGGGERRLDFEVLFKQLGTGMGVGALLSKALGNPETRGQYKANLEPLSLFGVGDENRARRIREENDQRELANKRAVLSLEEQIKAVAEERAKLQAEMDRTSDSVRKERLRSDLISLDAESIRLNQELGRNANVAPSVSNTQRDVDAYARVGLFVGGTRGVSLQEQMVTRLAAIEQALRETKSNQEGWWK